MKVDHQKGSRGFFVKQAILLIITVVLLIFFAVPLLKVVKAALNPAELESNVNLGKQEVAGLETKMETTESRILMGDGDDEVQGKLKEELEELKRQIASKELENKHLRDQMALVQTMLELVKAKPTDASVPVADTSHNIFELLTKIFGCIGSMFSGGMFLLAWWRRRREISQNAGS